VIFDALCSVVPTTEAFGGAEASLARLRGYQEHFGAAGTVPMVSSGAPLEAAIEGGYRKGADGCPSPAEFDAMLDEAGASAAVVYTEHYETSLGIRMATNDSVAEFVWPRADRLLGVAGVDPWRDDAPAEAERAVRELGLKGVIISPFKQRLLPADAPMARVFAICEHLGVPVYVHSGINWWVDTAYDIGHPRNIDALASAFPDLRIVALHAGWPWVSDMVMVAWRHPNVYLDISAHRPAHMVVEESVL
jgi:hypothetical protein